MNRIKILIVVFNLIIIVSAILCLFFNLNIFTLRYRYPEEGIFFTMDIRIFRIITIYSALEISIFYLITLASIINLVLSLESNFRYIRYSLNAITSLIVLISCILMFIYPKILIVNVKNDIPEFNYGSLYLDEVKIGGIIAIILSAALIINAIISILNDLRIWKTMKNEEPQITKSQIVLKNGTYQRRNLLTCPYCQSKVKLNDFYCMFCNGIVFINSIVYKFNTLAGE